MFYYFHPKCDKARQANNYRGILDAKVIITDSAARLSKNFNVCACKSVGDEKCVMH